MPLGAKIDFERKLLITPNANLPLLFDEPSKEYTREDEAYFDSILIEVNSGTTCGYFDGKT